MEPTTNTPPTPSEPPATPPAEPQQPPQSPVSEPTPVLTPAPAEISPEESTETVDEQTPPQSEGMKGVMSTIILLLLAPLIAIFLTMFVFQSYEVDGPSMQTTLNDNDRLVVWKLPRTWASVTRHDYIPARGDVIIFDHADGAAMEGSNKHLIKRVVGLPGERVVVQDGTLTVFNDEHPEGFSPDKTLSYGSVITNTPGNVDITVPEGEVFVAGDNRSNSLDSRYFGPVPASDIVGKLGVRIFPFSGIQLF